MNLTEAHKYSSNHREAIMKSTLCGCFYCLELFTPDKITEWVNDNTLAICPFCGIDSVLGNEDIKADIPH